jgi:NTP pyrophosphatase (non-canonical NTP hydrolase)
MPHLRPKPTLLDIQKYVADYIVVRGFDDEVILENVVMLGEEVGELFKAIRKAEHMNVDDNSEKHHLAHEIADVLALLLTVANHYQIDVEQAFREKEEINKKRVWKRS